jgi:hypothetical protein
MLIGLRDFSFVFHAIRHVTLNRSVREKNDHRIAMESTRQLCGDCGNGRSLRKAPWDLPNYTRVVNGAKELTLNHLIDESDSCQMSAAPVDKIDIECRGTCISLQIGRIVTSRDR